MCDKCDEHYYNYPNCAIIPALLSIAPTSSYDIGGVTVIVYGKILFFMRIPRFLECLTT